MRTSRFSTLPFRPTSTALIREALAQPHIKAILAQKPLGAHAGRSEALRDEAASAGKILSVNQNMRYDQSMRVLKQILGQRRARQRSS